MNPNYETYEVENRAAFAAAVLAASCATYSEAHQNPFSVSLLGTRFKLTAPRGMHEETARRVAARLRQSPQQIFRATV